VLLAIGAAVGVIAVVGLVAGFEPSKLPPALLNIAVYKLTFGRPRDRSLPAGFKPLAKVPPPTAATSSASPSGRRYAAL
jgi:hypothetical protein